MCVVALGVVQFGGVYCVKVTSLIGYIYLATRVFEAPLAQESAARMKGFLTPFLSMGRHIQSHISPSEAASTFNLPSNTSPLFFVFPSQ